MFINLSRKVVFIAEQLHYLQIWRENRHVFYLDHPHSQFTEKGIHGYLGNEYGEPSR